MNFILDNGAARVIIGRHSTKGYLMVEARGAGTSIFLDDVQLMEAACEMVAAARHIRKLRRSSPASD